MGQIKGMGPAGTNVEDTRTVLGTIVDGVTREEYNVL
jgi:hypothetical protein